MNTNKGKNYSTNKKKDERNPNDNYVTHPSMVEQLFEKEFMKDFILFKHKQHVSVCEPACGEYNIIGNVLNKHGFTVYTDDIIYGNDYMKFEDDSFDYVITNPPFKLFNEFILKSFEVTRMGFMLLGKIDFQTGKYRYDEIYKHWYMRPTHIVNFVRKPMLSETIRADGKYKTGIDGYAWYIWEHSQRYKDGYDTKIDWIDNTEFIYRKSDNIKYFKNKGLKTRDVNYLSELCDKDGRKQEDVYREQKPLLK